jgi:peptide deformylase
MAILPVLQIGHPTLRQRAGELTQSDLLSTEKQQLIDDMIATMRQANGAGLAANQVGQLWRICVIEVRAGNPRYPEKKPIPLTVLVNPILTPLSAETIESYEGCLSVPNLRGKVQRFADLRVDFWDRNGEECTVEAQGIPSVTYQHEVDHLDGTLFVDRVEDSSSLTTWENYSEYHA